MDYNVGNEDGDGERGSKSHVFFVEDLNSSEGEEVIQFCHQKLPSSCKRAARLSRGSSPPLLLAFNITSGRPSPTSSSDLKEEEEVEEDSVQPIEEWMLLGGEEQVGDSSIQLNLNYRDVCEEDDSGDEDQTVKSVKDTWAVSERDKRGADRSLPSRYFMTGRSLICNICKKTGHIAKNCCNHKKCPTCVLCGIPGHIQRDCPGRPCPCCGMPPHRLGPCERPRVWNQHCQRCGMSGHLADACPDTWRQYHVTIRLELPVKPWTVHILKKKNCPAHCCNCSKRGHYGYECTKRRMISGTFPSLPYVCHYDTADDVLQCRPEKQQISKELLSASFLPLSDQQQEKCGPAGRRKKWPEKRRERRKVKKLRKDAQAKQKGGPKRSGRYFSDEVCPADLHGHNGCTPPAQKNKKNKKKKKKDGADGKDGKDGKGGKGGKDGKDGKDGKSRKSREAAKWKKRGGIKRGNLRPHGDVDIRSESLLSPKQRVRRRQR